MTKYQYSSRVIMLNEHNDIVYKDLGKSFDGDNIRVLKASAAEDTTTDFNLGWTWLPMHMRLAYLNGCIEEDDYFHSVMNSGRASFSSCETPWFDDGKHIEQIADEICTSITKADHVKFGGYHKHFAFYGGDLTVRPSQSWESLIFKVTIYSSRYGQIDPAGIPRANMRSLFLEMKEYVPIISWRVPTSSVRKALYRMLGRAQAIVVRKDTQSALYRLMSYALDKYPRQFNVFVDWLQCNYPDYATRGYGTFSAADCWWLRNALTRFLPYYQVPEIYDEIPF